MTQPTVAPQVHQPLDVHGYFPAQIAFDNIFCNFCADGLYLRLSQVSDLSTGDNASRLTDIASPSLANTVYRLQCDYRMLIHWKIYACNTGHAPKLLIKRARLNMANVGS
jgi:hypothetical protein